jgi:hypothetical protein
MSTENNYRLLGDILGDDSPPLVIYIDPSETNLPMGINTKVYNQEISAETSSNLVKMSYPNAVSLICNQVYYDDNSYTGHYIRFSVSSMKNWGAGRIQFRGHNTYTKNNSKRAKLANDKIITLWFLHLLDTNAHTGLDCDIFVKRLSQGSTRAHTITCLEITDTVYLAIDENAIFE